MSANSSGQAWDHYADLVIVGSGASAVCAALLAKDRGLSSLIVEKLDVFGGTTAYSGGSVWIPDNPVMEREGVPDSFERGMQYLDAVVGQHSAATSDLRKSAFVRNGREAISYLENKGMKFLRPQDWPDYHSDLPGAEQTSRTVMAQLFDINELGVWKDRLAASKMAPFRFTLDKLSTMLLLKRTWKAKLLVARFVARLVRDRITGKDMRGGGAALQGRLLQIALKEELPIWLGTAVTGFVEEQGRVIGISAVRDGKPIRIGASRGVLLNAGGFARNASMMEKHGRKPVYATMTNASTGDTGEMIGAVIGLGAAVDFMDEALWGLSSVGPNGELPEGAVSKDGSPIPFGHHFDISLPHVIIVDQDGNRFGNEASSYMELGQRMYLRHEETGRGIPAWAIIESRHRDRYAWGPIVGKTPKSWLDSGYMKKADSIEALAAQCGIDPAALGATIERFNGFASAGVDADYGRGGKQFDRSHGDPTNKPNPSLGAIERAPFYAVRMVPGNVSTWGGLVTDEHARVLTEDGKVIGGVYATGTSTASVCGRSYPGAGASIGPSLTFGYIAAQHVTGSNIVMAGR